jgi:uncharacterized protein GlcG (DUF336 family)
MTQREFVRLQASVSFEAADEVIRAGMRKAEELGVRIGIVVVDANGFMVGMARMDGTPGRVEEAAGGKARAAGGLGVPTAEFIENRLSKPGNEALWRAMTSRPDTFMVQGGYPLKYGGKSVGGVGVSGAKHEDDSQVAEAAAERFEEITAGAPPLEGVSNR